MEGRQPSGLYLEMSDLRPEEYLAGRADEVGSSRVTLFVNEQRGRTDLPRTLPEFDTLAVHEVTAGFVSPVTDPTIIGSFHFERTARPGQGVLSDEPTNGLQLVLISPKDSARAQELRDWADVVHLRHIAEAAVPGFRMMTPYRNADLGGPVFLHFYEMHTDDPEGAFQAMTPMVADRLGGTDTEAYRSWAWHPALRIDYVNTFRRAASAGTSA